MIINSYNLYIKSVFISLSLLCSPLLLLNVLVDPLWHFYGNILTNQNFAFNERESKLNLFFQNPEKYDCYIFGSSRTTLLNSKEIEGYNCFNFSFSSGKVGEFLAYAQYLEKKNYYPKLIIVGVDGENFFSSKLSESIPGFIKNNKSPNNFLKDYLSIDSFIFSYRTLFGHSPLTRYYDKQFTAKILHDAPKYNPKKNTSKKATQTRHKLHTSFIPGNFEFYNKIKETYPKSKFIFYVPPISKWRIEQKSKNGRLDDYIKAIYSISKLKSPVYDFSIPSKYTSSLNNTYDGSHFNAKTNSLITKSINTGKAQFGERIDRIEYIQYKNHFINTLK